MATFHLQIVDLDGLAFDGEVQGVYCRTLVGQVGILAKHRDYCTAVGMGPAKVIMPDGTERYSACIGGMLSMLKNECRLIVTTWEWSDEIDVERAERAKQRAEEHISRSDLSEREMKLAEAKLRRALVRLSAARLKK